MTLPATWDGRVLVLRGPTGVALSAYEILGSRNSEKPLELWVTFTEWEPRGGPEPWTLTPAAKESAPKPDAAKKAEDEFWRAAFVRSMEAGGYLASWQETADKAVELAKRAGRL